MKLRELFVQLGVEVDVDVVNDFDKALKDVKSSMGDVAKGAAAMGAAIAGAFAGLGLLASREAEFAEEATRTARAFGVSTDMYQKMRFAFLSLNASSDDLADSLASIADKVQRAKMGQKQYIDTLQTIGMTWRDFEGLSPDQMFFKFGESVKATNDPMVQLSASTRILGNDLGRRLLPGLLDTNNTMSRFMNIAEQAGLVIDEDLLEKATEAQISFRELGATFQGVMRIIGIRLAPAFGKLARDITAAILQVTAFVNTTADKFGRLFTEEVEKFIGYFKAINDFVQKQGPGWVNILLATGAALSALVGIIMGKKIVAAAMAIKALFIKTSLAVAIGFAKLILIAAVVALAILAVVLIVEDLMGYFTGAKSWIGDFIESFKSGEGVLGSFARYLVIVLDWIKILVGFAVQAFRVMAFAIGFLWQEAKGPLQVLIATLVIIVTTVILIGVAIAALVFLIIAGVLLALAVWIKFVSALVKAWLWAVGLVVDAFWGLWEGLKGVFYLLTGRTDAAIEKFKKMGAIFEKIFNKIKGGLDTIVSLNPFGGKGGIESKKKGDAKAAGPGMLSRMFGGGTNKGSSGGNTTTQVGDVKVEVNVPEGTEVSESVAHQTGEKIHEELAKAINATAGY